MLIINHKHKDYYDGVAGTTGIDKTIVYDRQIVEVEKKDFPKIFRSFSSFDNLKPSPLVQLNNTIIKKKLRVVYEHTSPFIIGFCGKLYVGWKLYSNGKVLPYGGKELITIITYDNETMKKMVQRNGYYGNFEDNLNYVLTYDSIHLFREFNSPVFIYDSAHGITNFDRYRTSHPKLYINPLLKEYEFFKVFDAFQAFQEIQMFLGGVLGNKEKEIINVADKYKIDQYGFDKWSFRKEPEKK